MSEPATNAPGAFGTEELAAPDAKKRVRVPFWDNARFLCVMLVVIGHGIQRQTIDSDNALAVYLVLYAFHMPAFAIISGYFSKSGPPTGRGMKRVITDILLPYFIMETIWTVVQWLVEGKTDVNLTKPSWTLWFLLALGIFRLVLPYLALVRWPLFWAVLLSIGVGYLTNVDNTFSLSRTIGILPFFVLGWKLNDWHLVDRWRFAERAVWWIRAAAIAALAAWGVVVYVFIDTWREMDLRFWFFYDDNYKVLGEDQWYAGLLRLAFILLAVLLSFAFFALVPRSNTWITAFGQSTMYVYLLHSFVLYPIRESDVLRGDNSNATALISMILACVGISILLSGPWVRRVFRPLVEPRPRWLFVEADDSPARSSRTDPTGSRRDR
ncbi:acyltransferase family protein [Planctomonas deserti]|uniref:acyltransferase family protein n=1 Tax=Planctomonas deserti TaxID=2144185 RepID=UPI001F0BD3B0|nr:acyltransferase family protein [Planctomonas deserti]